MELSDLNLDAVAAEKEKYFIHALAAMELFKSASQVYDPDSGNFEDAIDFISTDPLLVAVFDGELQCMWLNWLQAICKAEVHSVS